MKTYENWCVIKKFRKEEGIMAKKSIVVEIMETRFAPHGFVYGGYADFRWNFTREMEGVTQEIVIQKDLYDEAYTLEFSINDVPESTCRFNRITDDPEYKEQFLSYRTKEEQIMVLNKLGDFVDKYGINKLNQLVEWDKTRVKRIKPTIDMSKKLCEEHTELTLQFIQRNNAEDLTEEEILQLAIKELFELRGKKYEEIQDKLVELAAVYGDMFIKKVGGCLKYHNGYKVAILSIPLDPAELILEDIINAWQNSQEDNILEYYDRKCARNIEAIKIWRKRGGDDWQKKDYHKKRCGYKIPLY